MPEPSDEDLAARCDLTGLYDRYAARILAFVSSRGLNADLDDALQNIWIRVHKALSAQTFAGHFSGWLFQIARNVIIDFKRKAPPPAELPPDASVCDLETPQVVLTRREVFAQLELCLQGLDEKEQKVVRAKSAGHSYDELQLDSGIEVNAAYKIYHKAKAKLADCMKRAGYESGDRDNP